MKKISAVCILFAGISTHSIAAKPISIPNEKNPKSGSTYFGFYGTTEVGLKGTLSLNGKQIFDFDGTGSQISSNQPQDLLKVGPNKFVLSLRQIDPKLLRAKRKPGDGAFVGKIHGLDEKDFPDESNVIGRWVWNPTPKIKAPIQLAYTFNLKSRKPIPKEQSRPQGAPVDEKTKTDITERYLELAKFFGEKNVNTLGLLASERAKLRAAKNATKIESEKETMKAEWTSWFTADSKVETAAENQIDFETIKSGRILVKRKDSKMIFKVSSDTNVAGYPTLIFCPGTVSWKWCGVGAVDPDFL